MTGATATFPQVCFQLNNRARLGLAVSFCILLVASPRLTASEYLSISLGTVGDAEWQAQGVVLQLDLQTPDDRFVLSAQEIRHPALPAPARSLRFECQRGKIEGARITCQNGLLDLTLKGQKQRRIKSIIDWNISSQQIDLKLNNISLAGGKVAADLSMKDAQWRLSLDGRKLRIRELGTLRPSLAQSIRQLSLDGRLDLSMELHGWRGQLRRGSGRVNYSGVSFSTGSGDYIGEGVAGEWRGTVALKKGQWSGNQQIRLSGGELLTPLIYLSPATHPLSVETRYSYAPNGGRLSLETFRLNQPKRLDVSGTALVSVEEARLVSLELASQPADIAPLFRDNVLPVLGNPQLEDMELAGQFALDISHQGDNTRVSIELEDTYIEQGLQTRSDGKGQFALYDLDGKINWSDGPVEKSYLSWQGGHLFGDLVLGSSSVDLLLSGDSIALLEQAGIPVLDGTLQAEKFSLTRTETGPRAEFQGYLTPVSMTAISNALGWPPLAGQLSGMIPGLAYEDGVIAVNGVALVKIFDGEIVIRDLKLEDLFGALPALSADLELKNIDLETLTRAFSFGKITGKLAGRVDDLRLEDWAPASFDAAFYTPEDDDSRHRISQKAVDNISNLGGSGVSGAISRSFLRMFEEFGYDRLGISCRLERGVCHMGGIEPAERGYYLVKGGGLPRIHIMGYNQKTDWQVLVSKLKQIAAGGEPVIK